MKRVTVWAGFILLLMAVAGLGACLVLAERTAAQYEIRVQKAAHGLAADFTVLGDTTYKGVIDDPDQSPQQTQRDLEVMRQAIAKTRQHIAVLDQAGRSLAAAPLTSLSIQYRNARVLQVKTQTTVQQVNETLTGYDSLTGFIEAYMQARATLQMELGRLNGTSDFNDFAGQGDAFRASAARLRVAREKFMRAATPPALADLQANMSSMLERAATEFDALGHGYDVAVDDLIYGPIHRIEAITVEFDAQNRTKYVPMLQDLRTIKEVRDLSEKLDPLMEPLL